ncbi:putative holliday junction resolvase [Sanguibacter gelidistatuariae]|uniref:Putative pre-16S rRNA nuclease n=1 Tax=Sanguibacter gelidistatuariae TaxID=1814289 RepID=A0A1G6JTC4_9MICO|nr:Holliday junction resolvase RuvX [Sanguibacter gelidistatuariae]SDC21908.1 putative holliday junction resolvase [Sanguibacter gelidistatuariae]
MSDPASQELPQGLPRGPRLCIDVGSVRVGVAASDPDGLIATPVDTLARDMVTAAKNPAAVPTDVAQIATEVDERGVKVVYVGLPRHLSGAEGSASASARAYAGFLAAIIAPVPVRMVDERMSTVSAHQALHASGRAGRKHRSVIDQVAAVVILQSSLERERSSGERAGELIP